MLKVKVGIPGYGSVAIDDIKLNHGACKRGSVTDYFRSQMSVILVWLNNVIVCHYLL